MTGYMKTYIYIYIMCECMLREYASMRFGTNYNSPIWWSPGEKSLDLNPFQWQLKQHWQLGDVIWFDKGVWLSELPAVLDYNSPALMVALMETCVVSLPWPWLTIINAGYIIYSCNNMCWSIQFVGLDSPVKTNSNSEPQETNHDKIMMFALKMVSID